MFKRRFDSKPLTVLCTLLVAVCLSAFALTRSGEWTLNPSDFRYDMSLWFSVDPAHYGDLDSYEIGAFVGDECRGKAQKIDLPDGGSCLYMRVRSNSASSEELSLLARPVGSEETVILKAGNGETLSFKADEMVGMPSSPYVVTPWFEVTVGSEEHGGVEFENGLYAYGTELTLKVETEMGYHFTAWSDGNTDNPRTIKVEGDLDLTAGVAVDVYRLTLNIDDEEFFTAELDYGAPVTAPEVPEREGYTFTGWFDLPATMPAQDLTLNGTYTANSYRLSLIVDGSEFEVRMFAYGAAVEIPEMPEREGYTFSGWNDEVPETMPAHDVEISGEYKVNTYKLTLVLDGEDYREFEVEYGTPLNREDFDGAEPEEREGYTFTGWGEVPETMPARDLDLNGSFTVNSYQLTLLLNGDVYEVMTVEYGATLQLPVPPEQEGQVFGGWDDAPETMPAHDLTLEGEYDFNGYTLTFIVDGTVYELKVVEYRSPIQVPELPEREGYTFSGWGEVPERMPARDLTFEAEYVLNSYKLTLIVDGEVYKEEEVAYGTELKIEDPEEREGYTFSGWGEVLKTMPARDLELEGQYVANIYRLTLMVDNDVYEVRNLAFGEDIVLPEMETRDGYTFSGWGEVPATMPAEDIELSAKYVRNLYKLTVYIDGELYYEAYIPFDGYVFIPEPEAPEGKMFEGWIEVVPETMPDHDLEINGKFGTIVGLDAIDAEAGYTIFTVNGAFVGTNLPAEYLRQLQPGLYIINGKKVLVK
ncbi:MAG: InlB B-repeat-containing protein [Muribaculaceae bacterium]|nr:InlB B-repeat-containing protein [Muribaculaceae bacterium]